MLSVQVKLITFRTASFFIKSIIFDTAQSFVIIATTCRRSGMPANTTWFAISDITRQYDKLNWPWCKTYALSNSDQPDRVYTRSG